jgi:hypothetical protein
MPRLRPPRSGGTVDNTAVPHVVPSDYGLTEEAIEEIRARDQRQARLFARLLMVGCGALWLAFSALIYAHSARRAPLLGLVMAPLLGGLGAAIGGLPVAILGGIVSWIAYPKHPLAGALEIYEAATAGIRVCDVCLLALGDDTPKEGVSYCGRCGAWMCPDCRKRYDLRAIAALRRARARGAGAGPREST